MTDNEIIKALECCAEPVGINCVKCPFEKNCLEINMCEMALELINRQKAENSNLTSDLTSLQNDLTSAKAEIKRFKNAFEQIKWERDLFEEQCKTAKAEAIKEFAEDVYGEIDDAIHSNYNAKEEREAKSKKLGIPIDAEDSYLMYCDGKIHALSGIRNYIYNLVKEMEGENE